MDYVEIGGKKRPVKFGINQTAILCRLRKTNLKGIEHLIDHKKFLALDVDGSEIRDLIYSALVAGCKTEKKEVDFDENDVGDWIDDNKGIVNDFLTLHFEASIPPVLRVKFKEKMKERKALK